MEVNANRWYLILNSNVNTIAVSGEIYVKNIVKNRLLRMKLIRKLSFKNHVNPRCKT